jgi:hypothetical protein
MSPVNGFRSATEAEVVLAFLRGEVDSDRFGDRVRRALADAGGLHLVRAPDLDSDEENRARGRALAAARGWPDRDLFEGFPADVDWYHGVLPPEVLARVRYIDYPYWIELSGGSRRPVDVLPTLRSGRLPAWVSDLGTGWCVEFAGRLAAAEAVADVIVVATRGLDELVVVEGHARLTAVFVGGLQDRLAVPAYLGLSADVRQWGCF